MPVPAHTYCPGCRQALLLPDNSAGRPIRCPRCRQAFTLRLPGRGPRWRIEGASSPGKVRSRNEDGFLVQQLTWAGQAGRHDLALLAVADGMGGHQAGDRASALAIGGIARALGPRLMGLVAGEESSPGPEALLEMVDFALWEAHRAIVRVSGEEPDTAGMGATAVVALVFDGTAAVCHVGDCRAYHLRGGLSQVTTDQTLARRMVELGQLSDREARSHPASSQVTQALGRQHDLEPSRRTIPLRAGEGLLLACDGLHTQVEEEEILATLQQGGGAEDLVVQANDRGGRDNCTVALVRLG